MTLEEARALIGRSVIYQDRDEVPEQGFITGVGRHYVFVRYAGDGFAVATPPELLTLEMS